MKSLHFLSINFAERPIGKSTDPGEFNFCLYFPLKSLNLVLIPCVERDSHLATWIGCLNVWKDHLAFKVSGN